MNASTLPGRPPYVITTRSRMLAATELKRDEDAAVAKLPKLCLKCFALGCGGGCS